MIIVSAPVVGLMMGGLYSLPALKITRGRDPWLTLLLAVGLSITVLAIGIVVGQPWQHLAMLLSAAILGLIAMRTLFGSFNGNLERFGLIHTATLMLLAFVLLRGKVRGRS